MNIGNGDSPAVSRRPEWSDAEVSATVEDYFEMLHLEALGQEYSKAEHRRSLLKKLNGRSAAAVEFKHANISAILHELGLPYISGYKPRKNCQEALRKFVKRYAQEQTR